MKDVDFYKAVREYVRFIETIHKHSHIKNHLKTGGIYPPPPHHRFIHEVDKRLARAKLKEKRDA